jgi:hypothetical protein
MGLATFRRLAIAVAVVGGLALTGCGGKDDAAPLPPVPQGTTPPLSKEDYVLRANKICAASDKLITGLTNDNGPINNSSGQGSTDALKELVAKIRPIAQNAIDQLKTLTPPPADAAMITRGITMMQTKLDQSQTSPSDTLDPIGQPDKELYTYGLYACFTNPGG